jgi:hypothetical protein
MHTYALIMLLFSPCLHCYAYATLVLRAPSMLVVTTGDMS